MKTHELKIMPEYFESVISGKKKAELRRNDRHFSAGDKLLLKEWSLEHDYSGRSVECIITDVADVDAFAKDYVLLSIKVSAGVLREKFENSAFSKGFIAGWSCCRTDVINLNVDHLNTLVPEDLRDFFTEKQSHVLINYLNKYMSKNAQ